MNFMSEYSKLKNINELNYYIPSREEFINGYKKFEEYEKRDAMYKVATFLVSHFWGKPAEMADGLGVLLLTWNQAFYRYGIFDFDRLEECIENPDGSAPILKEQIHFI